MVVSLGPPNITALIAGLLSGRKVPIFVTQHNALSNQTRSTATIQQKLVPWAYRLLFPYAAGVLAVSAGVADDMAAVTGYPRQRIHILHNPAYPQDLDGKLSRPFVHPFFATEEPVVVAVGRLIDQKAFDVLIRAIGHCRNKRPVRLAILGVGPLEEKLRQQASEANLSNAVALLGFQENPLLFMKNAAMFVMSSRYEGFGNVLVEAMACGTPVVSTDCNSGPAEILVNGRYGRLVPVDNAEALAEAILATLDDEIDREALRHRAMDFSAAQVTQRYLEVLFADRP
jgi:glycosyltransferase involved in cell wall biosynthesis